ncbi:MAG: beta-ketoacyl-ACP synthase III [Cellulosilyticaceae bacterium]
MNGVKIVGTGKALPSNRVTNDDLSKVVDTTDEWIKSRTGISTRYLSKGETTTQLAIEAAKAAMLDGGIDPETIDLIIVATITPDSVMPSTACLVQEAIGATRATAFDITAACSGFLYASMVAADAIKLGRSETALIIGAEVLSKVVNWEDRATCVLFGDGAGAAVYQKTHKNNIINIYSESDGASGNALTLSGRKLNNPYFKDDTELGHMYMDGRAVYKFATHVVPSSIEKVLEGTGVGMQDVDMFILHQANERIMDSVAKKIGVDSTKFFKNLANYGNTSAATIPIALSEAKEFLKPGDKVVLCGFGGGLTWGSMLLEW